jgi:hypothetical protein
VLGDRERREKIKEQKKKKENRKGKKERERCWEPE